MKRIFLPLILFLPQFLSAQGWVWLQREGMAGQVAVHCADEGADGHIYGIAEIDYDPYFVKFSPDGELLGTQALPVDQYYQRFQKFGAAHFLGWGHNVVSVFDATGDFVWSQTFPDLAVKDANIAGDKILVLSKQDSTPWKISRFLADGSPDGEITFQTATECRFIGSDGGSGFIAAGNYEYVANNYKPTFVKIDAGGNVTQEVQLTGFAAASIERVAELPGGAYAMIGLGWSTADSGIRGHVVKVTPALTQEWVKPLSAQFQGKQVIASPDGGLLAVGWGTQDYLNAVKLDAQGAVQWSRSFYKSSQSILLDAATTADGGYLLMGQLFGGIAIGVGRILIKTDSAGVFYSHTIKGKIYSDANTDCTVQPGNDLPAAGVTVTVHKLFTEPVQSNSNGVFYAIADTGTYVLKPLLPSHYWAACADSVTVQVGTPDTATAELQLTPLIDCPRMEASVGFDRVRPCFNTTYYIRYTNTGTASAPAATMLLETDPGMTYIESSIPLSGQQGANGYLFGLGDVPALGMATFWVKMAASCDLDPGDTVCATVHVFPDTVCSGNDPDSTFFTDTWCRVVTASFDPNQKTAYPPGIGDEHYLAPGSEIGYLIDFQNTGTDTAFNVVIYDTLSPWLDPRTIQAGASSHPYELKREGERVLKFVFRNVLLPDSNTNEAASHGFVRYYIRPLADVPIGTLIPNRAAIYFDFNAPVITEDCFHTLGFPVSALSQPLEAVDFSLWPNPAGDLLRVRLETPGTLRRITICHAAGPAMEIKDVRGETAHDFDVSGWPSGAYFVTLETENGARVSKKLVVLR